MQIACHKCDLILTLPPVTERSSVYCVRCGSLLFRRKIDSINRTIAWTVAGMVLFLVAITFPFMGMKISGSERHADLLTGIYEIYGQGMFSLAFLVLLTCVLAPLAQMLGLLYVLVPLKFDRVFFLAIPIFRTFRHIQPWSMMEVFMLGILVSWVKLSKMFIVTPGVAVFAFSLLIFAIIFAVSSVDSDLIWKRIEELAND